MAKDFFEELGEAITKTAREIGGRAEVLYGTQKLKNKISGEERQIQKIMEELGKVLYRRYREGVPLDDLQRRLCEQIDQRMTRIEQYKEEMAGVRSKKVCPSCGTVVDQDAAFCHHCGAACTTKEKEEAAGSVIDGTMDETVKSEEAPAWKIHQNRKKRIQRKNRRKIRFQKKLRNSQSQRCPQKLKKQIRKS